MSAAEPPAWLAALVDLAQVRCALPFLYHRAASSGDATQTAQTFSYKWAQHDTFSRPEFRQTAGRWYQEKYGPLTEDAWWDARPRRPRVVEIGPGSGISAEFLLGPRLSQLDYLGVDISTSIETADACLRGLGGDPCFLQADFLHAPLRPGSADLVLSEGVLHHTDDTRAAVARAADLVAPGGRLAFYVYKQKAPCREFTDDHVRAQVADLPPEEAWAKLLPLTQLGRALGELGVEVEVPADVDVLGIPAGTHDVQRLFYYSVVKCFYNPELTLEELNHVNFDWFTPKNCHRHTPEEVRSWFAGSDFTLTWFRVEPSGITVVADRA
ncbi:MAG: methyltransferase domain-containing protein [Planctomycetota bacterium]